MIADYRNRFSVRIAPPVLGVLTDAAILLREAS
jgi:hypothetical protein